jgi:hypothetical protein
MIRLRPRNTNMLDVPPTTRASIRVERMLKSDMLAKVA